MPNVPRNAEGSVLVQSPPLALYFSDREPNLAKVAELDFVLFDGNHVMARRQSSPHVAPGPSPKDDNFAVRLAQHGGQQPRDPRRLLRGVHRLVVVTLQAIAGGTNQQVSPLERVLLPIEGNPPLPLRVPDHHGLA